ncbi:MAG: bifunctional phosphopantothenoylcysteine decarboxylase/phosphopantothenate--cysteine ligase CoaBC [Bacteroides sp.]|nr:bifunctional phosphopantothenoylcysteine decarboxylase/phosphopantothenate--cysteine ligase CoaBC [Bacillota bacterium]MCM1455385.1 bifunctional phosphopantothenoylcysteine decarboxylase/phosphopantothenate--cysteine ligase CoaBC [Bacteroides sp.]
MLCGKNVVLGVSGGIACYKACEIVSRLKKAGADVDVIMTEHAREFVTPLTFQTLAKSTVISDEFAPVKEYDVKHISLAKKADIFVVAPATANVIAKFAGGIADDMLSTTYLACNAKKLICPAMNVNMYEDAATKKNIAILKERGVAFCEPSVGLLACGDVGKGRLAEPVDIVDAITNMLTPSQDLDAKTVLVTAGGTEENIDAVRFITNRSSGKMGAAIATAAMDRGAKVIFVHGNVSVDVPRGVEAIKVRTAEEMYEACNRVFESCDIAILAGAPADYRPKSVAENKIKSENLTIEFVKNPDIARSLSEKKGCKKLVIFAAETENIIENAKNKLAKKHADLVVANDVTAKDAGFDTDTNIATIIDNLGNRTDSGKVSKRELADIILDKVLAL